MIASMRDLNGYLLVVSLCITIGAVLWAILRLCQTLTIIVTIVVTTSLFSVPLVIFLALESPPPFMSPRTDRQNTIELQVYASSATELPYTRSGVGSEIEIPNHLHPSEEKATISITYMKEIGEGEDGCFAVQIVPPDAGLSVSIMGNGSTLAQISACKSFTIPLTAYRAITPSAGRLFARINISRLSQFLADLDKPWRMQASVNGTVLTEDARDSDFSVKKYTGCAVFKGNNT